MMDLIVPVGIVVVKCRISCFSHIMPDRVV